MILKFHSRVVFTRRNQLWALKFSVSRRRQIERSWSSPVLEWSLVVGCQVTCVPSWVLELPYPEEQQTNIHHLAQLTSPRYMIHLDFTFWATPYVCLVMEDVPGTPETWEPPTKGLMFSSSPAYVSMYHSNDPNHFVIRRNATFNSLSTPWLSYLKDGTLQMSLQRPLNLWSCTIGIC